MKTKLCATMPMCCEGLCWIRKCNSGHSRSSLRKRIKKTWSSSSKSSPWRRRCGSSISSFKRRRWSWRLSEMNTPSLSSHLTIKRDSIDLRNRQKSPISYYKQTPSPKIQIVNDKLIKAVRSSARHIAESDRPLWPLMERRTNKAYENFCWSYLTRATCSPITT